MGQDRSASSCDGLKDETPSTLACLACTKRESRAIVSQFCAAVPGLCLCAAANPRGLRGRGTKGPRRETKRRHGHHEHIDEAGLQPRQALLRLLHRIIAEGLRLGQEEEVFPGDSAGLDPFRDRSLRLVVPGRVDPGWRQARAGLARPRARVDETSLRLHPPAASQATVAAVMRSWVAVLLAEPSTRMPEPQPRLTYGLPWTRAPAGSGKASQHGTDGMRRGGVGTGGAAGMGSHEHARRDFLLPRRRRWRRGGAGRHGARRLGAGCAVATT